MDLSKLNQEQLKKLGVENLNPEERELVQKVLNEMSEDGDSRTLKKLYEADYEEIPVDIDTFIESNEYLGKSLDNGRDIFPFWRDQLRDIFDDDQYIEAIFTGAIGIGKTTIAVICLCYILYKLMCLKNPQSYHGLTSGSKIGIAFFNVTKEQSEGVAFGQMQTYLLNSPWFQERGTVRGTKDERYVPGKDIEFVIGSQEEHGLGRDIFCLEGETEVLTKEGKKSLEELSKEYPVQEVTDKEQFYGANDLTTVDKVILSYNEEGRFLEWKSFDGVHEVDVADKDVYRIDLVDKKEIVYSIYATEDHKFLVLDKDSDYCYLEAQDLKEGMEIKSATLNTKYLL